MPRVCASNIPFPFLNSILTFPSLEVDNSLRTLLGDSVFAARSESKSEDDKSINNIAEDIQETGKLRVVFPTALLFCGGDVIIELFDSTLVRPSLA